MRKPKIHYRVFGMTDRGRVRQNNEDSFAVIKNLDYFAVADGMGGHAKGEVASDEAVRKSGEEASALFRERQAEDTFTQETPEPAGEAALHGIVRKANRAVQEKSGFIPRFMGTTFVCAKLLDGKMYVASSGDSRCYHIRKESMIQLTRDHSPLEDILQAGRARGDESELQGLRRFVRGALGMDEKVEPDILISIPRKGDRYLFCTDGLTKMLPDEKILAVLRSGKKIQQTAHQLVAEANAAGGRDNITVILLEMTGIAVSGQGRPSPIGPEEESSEESTWQEE